MSFAIGQQVGPYRIEQKLGQGGMATVYKAHHEALDRYVAIKVMHIALSEDASFLERFKREAQIVGKLSHPNVIPIHDYAAFEDQPYLVMQHIEGYTLKQRMRRRPLTLQEVTAVLNAVAGALDYAHQNDILHRDVKPSNIMLDERGKPYLTDFGLARIASLGESTLSTDMMLGTPQYISPEQAKGTRNLDAGTDIYSLGVVLYELVVGRVPFTADTPYTIIHDHIYKPLPSPSRVNPGVPPAVEQVLVRVLQKDRRERYETAGDLAKHFAAAVRKAEMKEISHQMLRPEAFEASEPPPSTPSGSVPAKTSDGIPIEVITPTPVDLNAMPSQAQSAPSRSPVPARSPIPTPAIPTPTPAVPSPMAGAPPGSVLVPGNAVNYQVQPSGNGWAIGGCLIFILSCLFSVGIVATAMGEPQFTESWDDIRNREANTDEFLDGNRRPAPMDSTQLLSMARDGDLRDIDVQIYLQENPDEIAGLLAAGWVALQDDDAAGASEYLSDLQIETLADITTIAQWAIIYVQDGHNNAAFSMYLTMLNESDTESENYEYASTGLDTLFLTLIRNESITSDQFEAYVAAFPESTYTQFANSMLQYTNDNIDEATETLDRLFANDAPPAVDDVIAWADTMRHLEADEMATRTYIAALGVYPDDDDLHEAADTYLYERLLTDASESRLSQTSIDAYTAIYPDAIEVNLAQALVHFENGNREEGSTLLRQLLAERQLRQDVDVILDWGGVFAGRGYDEQATLIFLSAYVHGENNENVRQVAGTYLYDQATNIASPNEVALFCNLSNIVVTPSALINVITAQALISSGIEIDRPTTIMRFCESWTGDDSLLGLLESAETLNDELAELYLVYGNYYEYIDDERQALSSWEQATSFDDAPEWVIIRAENKQQLYLSE